MPNYDSPRYDPPAPVAQVVLRDRNGGALLPGRMSRCCRGWPWNAWA
jgi:hypothetical protein